tara:strand:- start:17880 stop:18350 length:471 start_codon:yes stop_codon:yes gene_type:complete
MATIKKAFVPIMSLLAASMGSEVTQELYDQAEVLTCAKTGNGGSQATSFHKDDEGNVVAIRCSYFQEWFKPSEVEFGLKASSASGFNPMCKAAVSAWTKQQADFKKAKEALLEQVVSGDLEPANIPAHIDELEIARTTTASHDFTGYDSLEALLEA